MYKYALPKNKSMAAFLVVAPKNTDISLFELYSLFLKSCFVVSPIHHGNRPNCSIPKFLKALGLEPIAAF